MTPKWSQIQKSELLKLLKMKADQLYEKTQKRFFNSYPTLKTSHRAPKNSRKLPQNEVKIEIENWRYPR